MRALTWLATSADAENAEDPTHLAPAIFRNLRERTRPAAVLRM